MRSNRMYGAGSKGKATRLHSLVVRSRGRCEKCGTTNRALECAHIVSRRYSATRTDENGAWSLCFTCHRRLTEHPEEHVAFAVRTLGQDGYDALLRKAYDGVNGRYGEPFWQEEVVRLTALMPRDLGDAA